MTKNCELLNRIEWPCDLPEIARTTLLQKAAIIQVNDTSELQAKLPNNIIYVLSGVVISCMVTNGIRAVSGVVIGKGCWFGLINLGEIKTPYFQFEIVEPLVAVSLPEKHCQSLAEIYPQLYKWLWHVSLDISSRWLQSQVMSGESIMTKLVYLLLDIAAHQGSTKAMSYPITLSQYQFSNMTGISRSRLNHALKTLEQNNEILISRGHITINNFEKLGQRLNDLDLSFRDPRTLIN
ncbi:hypothetical protein tloyanaT_17310 [Thalassotalea loyana]|uniref:HTH crp-type domain-containing protein n=1 Tax=Thalassotalea loyana TaxID=280483 RepID=A0ABQ6HD51_9GAMM|nr:Crp/Fnr family transcriptional regulator [Thalassotalea loyana]GLX85479.1 hypothetical protein tloyanaT_17310 [Thalassotalea loyana]